MEYPLGSFRDYERTLTRKPIPVVNRVDYIQATKEEAEKTLWPIPVMNINKEGDFSVRSGLDWDFHRGILPPEIFSTEDMNDYWRWLNLRSQPQYMSGMLGANPYSVEFHESLAGLTPATAGGYSGTMKFEGLGDDLEWFLNTDWSRIDAMHDGLDPTFDYKTDGWITALDEAFPKRRGNKIEADLIREYLEQQGINPQEWGKGAANKNDYLYWVNRHVLDTSLEMMRKTRYDMQMREAGKTSETADWWGDMIFDMGMDWELYATIPLTFGLAGVGAVTKTGGQALLKSTEQTARLSKFLQAAQKGQYVNPRLIHRTTGEVIDLAQTSGKFVTQGVRRHMGVPLRRKLNPRLWGGFGNPKNQWQLVATRATRTKGWKGPASGISKTGDDVALSLKDTKALMADGSLIPTLFNTKQGVWGARFVKDSRLATLTNTQIKSQAFINKMLGYPMVAVGETLEVLAFMKGAKTLGGLAGRSAVGAGWGAAYGLGMNLRQQEDARQRLDFINGLGNHDYSFSLGELAFTMGTMGGFGFAMTGFMDGFLGGQIFKGIKDAKKIGFNHPHWVQNQLKHMAGISTDSPMDGTFEGLVSHMGWEDGMITVSSFVDHMTGGEGEAFARFLDRNLIEGHHSTLNEIANLLKDIHYRSGGHKVNREVIEKEVMAFIKLKKKQNGNKIASSAERKARNTADGKHAMEERGLLKPVSEVDSLRSPTPKPRDFNTAAPTDVAARESWTRYNNLTTKLNNRRATAEKMKEKHGVDSKKFREAYRKFKRTEADLVNFLEKGNGGEAFPKFPEDLAPSLRFRDYTYTTPELVKLFDAVENLKLLETRDTPMSEIVAQNKLVDSAIQEMDKAYPRKSTKSRKALQDEADAKLVKRIQDETMEGQELRKEVLSALLKRMQDPTGNHAKNAEVLDEALRRSKLTRMVSAVAELGSSKSDVYYSTLYELRTLGRILDNTHEFLVDDLNATGRNQSVWHAKQKAKREASIVVARLHRAKEALPEEVFPVFEELIALARVNKIKRANIKEWVREALGNEMGNIDHLDVELIAQHFTDVFIQIDDYLMRNYQRGVDTNQLTKSSNPEGYVPLSQSMINDNPESVISLGTAGNHIKANSYLESGFVSIVELEAIGHVSLLTEKGSVVGISGIPEGSIFYSPDINQATLSKQVWDYHNQTGFTTDDLRTLQAAADNKRQNKGLPVVAKEDAPLSLIKEQKVDPITPIVETLERRKKTANEYFDRLEPIDGEGRFSLEDTRTAAMILWNIRRNQLEAIEKIKSKTPENKVKTETLAALELELQEKIQKRLDEFLAKNEMELIDNVGDRFDPELMSVSERNRVFPKNLSDSGEPRVTYIIEPGIKHKGNVLEINGNPVKANVKVSHDRLEFPGFVETPDKPIDVGSVVIHNVDNPLFENARIVENADYATTRNIDDMRTSADRYEAEGNLELATTLREAANDVEQGLIPEPTIISIKVEGLEKPIPIDEITTVTPFTGREQGENIGEMFTKNLDKPDPLFPEQDFYAVGEQHLFDTVEALTGRKVGRRELGINEQEFINNGLSILDIINFVNNNAMLKQIVSEGAANNFDVSKIVVHLIREAIKEAADYNRRNVLKAVAANSELEANIDFRSWRNVVNKTGDPSAEDYEALTQAIAEAGADSPHFKSWLEKYYPDHNYFDLDERNELFLEYRKEVEVNKKWNEMKANDAEEWNLKMQTWLSEGWVSVGGETITQQILTDIGSIKKAMVDASLNAAMENKPEQRITRLAIERAIKERYPFIDIWHGNYSSKDNKPFSAWSDNIQGEIDGYKADLETDMVWDNLDDIMLRNERDTDVDLNEVYRRGPTIGYKKQKVDKPEDVAEIDQPNDSSIEIVQTDETIDAVLAELPHEKQEADLTKKQVRKILGISKKEYKAMGKKQAQLKAKEAQALATKTVANLDERIIQHKRELESLEDSAIRTKQPSAVDATATQAELTALNYQEMRILEEISDVSRGRFTISKDVEVEVKTYIDEYFTMMQEYALLTGDGDFKAVVDQRVKLWKEVRQKKAEMLPSILQLTDGPPHLLKLKGDSTLINETRLRNTLEFYKKQAELPHPAIQKNAKKMIKVMESYLGWISPITRKEQLKPGKIAQKDWAKPIEGKAKAIERQWNKIVTLIEIEKFVDPNRRAYQQELQKLLNSLHEKRTKLGINDPNHPKIEMLRWEIKRLEMLRNLLDGEGSVFGFDTTGKFHLAEAAELTMHQAAMAANLGGKRKRILRKKALEKEIAAKEAKEAKHEADIYDKFYNFVPGAENKETMTVGDLFFLYNRNATKVKAVGKKGRTDKYGLQEWETEPGIEYAIKQRISSIIRAELAAGHDVDADLLDDVFEELFWLATSKPTALKRLWYLTEDQFEKATSEIVKNEKGKPKKLIDLTTEELIKEFPLSSSIGFKDSMALHRASREMFTHKLQKGEDGKWRKIRRLKSEDKTFGGVGANSEVPLGRFMYAVAAGYKETFRKRKRSSEIGRGKISSISPEEAERLGMSVSDRPRMTSRTERPEDRMINDELRQSLNKMLVDFFDPTEKGISAAERNERRSINLLVKLLVEGDADAAMWDESANKWKDNPNSFFKFRAEDIQQRRAELKQEQEIDVRKLVNWHANYVQEQIAKSGDTSAIGYFDSINRPINKQYLYTTTMKTDGRTGISRPVHRDQEVRVLRENINRWIQRLREAIYESELRESKLNLPSRRRAISLNSIFGKSIKWEGVKIIKPIQDIIPLYPEWKPRAADGGPTKFTKISVNRALNENDGYTFVKPISSLAELEKQLLLPYDMPTSKGGHYGKEVEYVTFATHLTIGAIERDVIKNIKGTYSTLTRMIDSVSESAEQIRKRLLKEEAEKKKKNPKYKELTEQQVNDIVEDTMIGNFRALVMFETMKETESLLQGHYKNYAEAYSTFVEGVVRFVDNPFDSLLKELNTVDKQLMEPQMRYIGDSASMVNKINWFSKNYANDNRVPAFKKEFTTGNYYTRNLLMYKRRILKKALDNLTQYQDKKVFVPAKPLLFQPQTALEKNIIEWFRIHPTNATFTKADFIKQFFGEIRPLVSADPSFQPVTKQDIPAISRFAPKTYSDDIGKNVASYQNNLFQHLKKTGFIEYDRSARGWRLTTRGRERAEELHGITITKVEPTPEVKNKTIDEKIAYLEAKKQEVVKQAGKKKGREQWDHTKGEWSLKSPGYLLADYNARIAELRSQKDSPIVIESITLAKELQAIKQEVWDIENLHKTLPAEDQWMDPQITVERNPIKQDSAMQARTLKMRQLYKESIERYKELKQREAAVINELQEKLGPNQFRVGTEEGSPFMTKTALDISVIREPNVFKPKSRKIQVFSPEELKTSAKAIAPDTTKPIMAKPEIFKTFSEENLNAEYSGAEDSISIGDKIEASYGGDTSYYVNTKGARINPERTALHEAMINWARRRNHEAAGSKAGQDVAGAERRYINEIGQPNMGSKERVFSAEELANNPEFLKEFDWSWDRIIMDYANTTATRINAQDVLNHWLQTMAIASPFTGEQLKNLRFEDVFSLMRDRVASLTEIAGPKGKKIADHATKKALEETVDFMEMLYKEMIGTPVYDANIKFDTAVKAMNNLAQAIFGSGISQAVALVELPFAIIARSGSAGALMNALGTAFKGIPRSSSNLNTNLEGTAFMFDNIERSGLAKFMNDDRVEYDIKWSNRIRSLWKLMWSKDRKYTATDGAMEKLNNFLEATAKMQSEFTFLRQVINLTKNIAVGNAKYNTLKNLDKLEAFNLAFDPIKFKSLTDAKAKRRYIKGLARKEGLSYEMAMRWFRAGLVVDDSGLDVMPMVRKLLTWGEATQSNWDQSLMFERMNSVDYQFGKLERDLYTDVFDRFINFIEMHAHDASPEPRGLASYSHFNKNWFGRLFSFYATYPLAFFNVYMKKNPSEVGAIKALALIAGIVSLEMLHMQVRELQSGKKSAEEIATEWKENGWAKLFQKGSHAPVLGWGSKIVRELAVLPVVNPMLGEPAYGSNPLEMPASGVFKMISNAMVGMGKGNFLTKGRTKATKAVGMEDWIATMGDLKSGERDAQASDAFNLLYQAMFPTKAFWWVPINDAFFNHVNPDDRDQARILALALSSMMKEDIDNNRPDEAMRVWRETILQNFEDHVTPRLQPKIPSNTPNTTPLEKQRYMQQSLHKNPAKKPEKPIFNPFFEMQKETDVFESIYEMPTYLRLPDSFFKIGPQNP